MSIHFADEGNQSVTTALNPLGAITIEGWFYINAINTTNDNYLVINPNSMALLFMNSGDGNANKLQWVVVVSGGTAIYSATLSATTWYYFRANHNATGNTTLKIWNVDGTEHTSVLGAPAKGNRASGTGLQISYNSSPNSWNGRVRNIWIANSYITSDADSLARMNSSNPLLKGVGTSAYFWPLVDGFDNREMVALTSSTLQNTPTTADDPPSIPHRF